MLDGDPAAQAAIAQRVAEQVTVRGSNSSALFPEPGEPVADAALRPTLIGALGKYRDPQVLGEANRLFAAWKQDPNAIPGSLKTDLAQGHCAQRRCGDLGRDSRASEGNSRHGRAGRALPTAWARPGRGLARRALDLALTNEPGKTISAGIISTVAALHPELAIDFVLAHLDQVNKLIDISGRSASCGGSRPSSHDASTDPGARRLCQGDISRRPTASRSTRRSTASVRTATRAADRCGSAGRGAPAAIRLKRRRTGDRVDRAAQILAIGARRVAALPFAHVRDSCRGLPLNLQPRRGQESFGAVHRSVVRCIATPSIQRPTDISARAFASSFC